MAVIKNKLIYQKLYLYFVIFAKKNEDGFYRQI